MAEKRQISDAEAKTIHSYFIVGTSSFVLTAILAHMLAWTWRPWF